MISQNMLSEVKNHVFIENTSISVKIQMAFLCSFSTISQMAYSAGKIETLGSIFRHETAKLFAAVLSNCRKANFIYCL